MSTNSKKKVYGKIIGSVIACLILIVVIILLCLKCSPTNKKQNIGNVVDTSLKGYDLVEDPMLTSQPRSEGNAQIYSVINYENSLTRPNFPDDFSWNDFDVVPDNDYNKTHEITNETGRCTLQTKTESRYTGSALVYYHWIEQIDISLISWKTDISSFVINPKDDNDLETGFEKANNEIVPSNFSWNEFWGETKLDHQEATNTFIISSLPDSIHFIGSTGNIAYTIEKINLNFVIANHYLGVSFPGPNPDKQTILNNVAEFNSEFQLIDPDTGDSMTNNLAITYTGQSSGTYWYNINTTDDDVYYEGATTICYGVNPFTPVPAENANSLTDYPTPIDIDTIITGDEIIMPDQYVSPTDISVLQYIRKTWPSVYLNELIISIFDDLVNINIKPGSLIYNDTSSSHLTYNLIDYKFISVDLTQPDLSTTFINTPDEQEVLKAILDDSPNSETYINQLSATNIEPSPIPLNQNRWSAQITPVKNSRIYSTNPLDTLTIYFNVQYAVYIPQAITNTNLNDLYFDPNVDPLSIWQEVLAANPGLSDILDYNHLAFDITTDKTNINIQQKMTVSPAPAYSGYVGNVTIEWNWLPQIDIGTWLENKDIGYLLDNSHTPIDTIEADIEEATAIVNPDLVDTDDWYDLWNSTQIVWNSWTFDDTGLTSSSVTITTPSSLETQFTGSATLIWKLDTRLNISDVIYNTDVPTSVNVEPTLSQIRTAVQLANPLSTVWDWSQIWNSEIFYNDDQKFGAISFNAIDNSTIYRKDFNNIQVAFTWL